MCCRHRYHHICVHACMYVRIHTLTHACIYAPTTLANALTYATVCFCNTLYAPAETCPATSNNPVAPGRCGPKFNNQFCSGAGYNIYCNEVNGWCGNSEKHQHAQLSTKYDAASLPAHCRSNIIRVHIMCMYRGVYV